MDSRERVLGAIRRTGVDRAPCNFRAEPPTLRRLYEHLGHGDHERLLDDFGVDIRTVDAVPPAEADMGGYTQNFWGERYVYRTNRWGRYRDDLPGALSGAATLKELKGFAWPKVSQMDYSKVAAQCAADDGRAILYGFGDIFTRPSMVRGFENFLLDMHERPEFVHCLQEIFTGFYEEEYARAWKECGGKVDVFFVMGDLSSQSGPLFSPAFFDEFVGPYMRRMADRIHELGALFMFHTCGDTYGLIDRMVGCGVDAIDPIQRTSDLMGPESLKARFGDRVAFHGGIDVQTTLPYGSEEEVRAEVRRYVDAFGKGGGYIAASSHLLQHDTPPENIVAMYDEIGRSRF
ncbi:MAG: hypothetical protein FWE70_02050 [Oscillospiraceae bacterium]|nr:hypothetical protein [Oscillospiraceae bacterium]